MTDPYAISSVPGWLRFWAWFTVCAALPLVLLGAETTTRGVGMADQVSLRSPWYFFTLDLADTPFGLRIEHSHRLFGWAVGCCCIVLALGMQVFARGGYRALGWIALVMVSAQGIFGILRVKWNALAGPELAAFHGGFAQLTFATLVAVAVLASRGSEASRPVAPRALRRSAVHCSLLLFAQIVFGAIVRHKLDSTAQRLHILLAFGVVVNVFWLAVQAREAETSVRRLTRFLLVLVVVQVVLGVEAWMKRFGAGILPELVPTTSGLAYLRSAHHLIGTLIFSSTVALVVLLRQVPVRDDGNERPIDSTTGSERMNQPIEGAV